MLGYTGAKNGSLFQMILQGTSIILKQHDPAEDFEQELLLLKSAKKFNSSALGQKTFLIRQGGICGGVLKITIFGSFEIFYFNIPTSFNDLSVPVAMAMFLNWSDQSIYEISSANKIGPKSRIRKNG